MTINLRILLLAACLTALPALAARRGGPMTGLDRAVELGKAGKRLPTRGRLRAAFINDVRGFRTNLSSHETAALRRVFSVPEPVMAQGREGQRVENGWVLRSGPAGDHILTVTQSGKLKVIAP